LDAEPTSTTLLARVREDDPEAWRCLSDQYAPAIYRWCRRDGVPPEDAADLVQQVLLAVFEGLDGFSRNGAENTLRRWIHRITRNRIVDWRRLMAVRPPAAPGGTSHHGRMLEIGRSPEAESVEDDVDAAAFSAATERVRAWCDERTWQIFNYFVIDGFSAQETAEEFGVTAGYAYVVRARILRRYREELQLIDDTTGEPPEP
jgi:RNA polymerase sigma-70 factor (ECF subfamily)